MLVVQVLLHDVDLLTDFVLAVKAIRPVLSGIQKLSDIMTGI